VSKKRSKRGARKPPKVFLCRGCCCGTRKKHPRSDAQALERVAREGASKAGYRFAKTKCLGPCGQGNIVVVRAAGTYRWFRKMDDVAETRCLVNHLAEHGNVEDVGLAHRRMPRRDGSKPR
jgi:(2Fe-2S) ferredoxin